MEINLVEDRKKIEAYVKERVEGYSSRSIPQLGNCGNPLTMVTFGYQVCQAGLVALVFDTRKDAEPDGEWTMAFEDVMLEFGSWYQALDEAYENESYVDVLKLDGEKIRVAYDDESTCISSMIGEMLKGILLSVESDIQNLSVTQGLLLSVEDFDGCYGWQNLRKGFPTVSLNHS